MIYDVVIIGGGLSGLVVANGLAGNSSRLKRWVLLEASDRLGGRLINASPTVPIDMGGAWIWPTHQPNIRDLIMNTLNITTFVQPDDPSSTRIEGGAVRMIEELTKKIQQKESNNSNGIVTNTHITSCKQIKPNIEDNQRQAERETLVHLTATNGNLYVARKVVFAIPPKIISENITFDPPLSDKKVVAMEASRTWMAGVTKVALVYTKKFWNIDSSNFGLPTSTGGPAFQVYDSSTIDNRLAALTFFVHVPVHDSQAHSDDTILAKQVATQMAGFWKRYGMLEYSSSALLYHSFHVYRWPKNPYIGGKETRPEQIHPHPMPIRALSTSEWDDTLFFASTETDQTAPGVMEGAVSAAKRVLQSLFQ